MKKIKNYDEFINEGLLGTLAQSVKNLASNTGSQIKKSIKDLLLEDGDVIKKISIKSIKDNEVFNMTLTNDKKVDEQYEFTKVGSVKDTASGSIEPIFAVRSTNDNLLKLLKNNDINNGKELIFCTINNGDYEAEDQITINFMNVFKFNATIKKIYKGPFKLAKK